MSTFYLLPPRSSLGAHFADYLRTIFPGLDWSQRAWPELAEALAGTASQQPDVYVVYREELPDEENLGRALADGFGAEPGDEIVEVASHQGAGPLTSRRWRLGQDTGDVITL
jgi:hypothetical protein